MEKRGLTALNKPDDFILAVSQIENGQGQLRYIRQPFRLEAQNPVPHLVLVRVVIGRRFVRVRPATMFRLAVLCLWDVAVFRRDRERDVWSFAPAASSVLMFSPMVALPGFNGIVLPQIKKHHPGP